MTDNCCRTNEAAVLLASLAQLPLASLAAVCKSCDLAARFVLPGRLGKRSPNAVMRGLLLTFLMRGMLFAKHTVLARFDAVGCVFLIFLVVVITLFALRASQSNLNPVTLPFRSHNLSPKRRKQSIPVLHTQKITPP